MKELLRKLHKTFKGPTLLAAAVYALSGGGFLVTTLVMARTLDIEAFAHATLIIAICNVAVAVAPSGIDGIVLRHDLRADMRLLQVAALTSMLTASVAAGIGLYVYRLGALSCLVIAAAVVTGGIGLAVKSSLQRDHLFQRGMMLSQSANVGLLVASGLMWIGFGRQPWFPTLLVAFWFAVIAWVAWRWAIRRPHTGHAIELRFWKDGANFVGVMLASGVMVQMERLLIPLVLATHDLALFAVVAAFVLAPYRMLEMGASSTLTARLRAATTVRERRQLMGREALALIPLAIAGGAALVALSPWLFPLMVGRKASVPFALIIAIVGSGIVRVVAALAHSAAGALCSGRELRLMNVNSWLAVGVGTIAGIFLSRFGLVGLVVGVTLGWAIRASLALTIAGRHLRP
jgi:hypothetical protein